MVFFHPQETHIFFFLHFFCIFFGIGLANIELYVELRVLWVLYMYKKLDLQVLLNI